MAQNLTDFLIGNPIDNTEKDVVISERLTDFKFRVKVLSGCEVDEINEKARKNKEEKRTEKYFILEACSYPNFKDTEMIKNAGCKTPLELLDKVLLPGEQSALYNAICEVCGYSNFKAQIDEVKN